MKLIFSCRQNFAVRASNPCLTAAPQLRRN